MNSSRRIAAALFVAIAAAGVVGWASHRKIDDKSTRIGDGTQVREPDRAERAVRPVTRTTEPELAGSRPNAEEPAHGRRRVLNVIVEGPSGRIAGATVAVEADAGTEWPEPSIAPPEPGRERRHDRALAAVTDARGRASFVLFADATASIDVAATGFTSRATTHGFAADDGPRTLEEALVRLEPATRIEGRVVDAGSGQPIEGADVDGGGADETRTKSDETGAFRLWTDATMREVRLLIHAEGHVDHAIDLQTWNGVVEPASITFALRRPALRGSIEVVVRDPKGRPVRSASVSIDPADEGSDAAPDVDTGVEETDGWRERGTTDGDGVLRVAHVPFDRDCVVSAFAPGLAEGRASAPVRLDATRATARVEITLGELASLVVTLLDPDGRPTGGLVRADSHFALDRTPDSPVGVYEFKDLWPGTVRVRARHTKFLTSAVTIDVRPGENHTIVRLDRGVAIHGIVLDPAGKPIRGARVTAEPTLADGTEGVERVDGSGAPHGRSGKTDEDGRFACEALAPGGHRLRAVWRPETREECSAIGTGTAQAPADDVRLVARTMGSIRATLLRPDARPLEGGVDLWIEAHGRVEHAESRDVEDGRVRLVDVADGEWNVGFAVGGLAPIVVPVSIRDGQTLDLGSLRFNTGASIRGRVVDAAGRPIDAASVTIGRSNAVSREDGSFEADLVARGRQVVKVLAEGFVTSSTAIDVADDGPVLEVRLSRGGVVRGRLQGFRQGGPDGKFRFVREASDTRDAAEPVDVTLRSDGRFFVPLAPGRWKAEWTPTDGATRDLGSVSVEESQVRDVDFTLQTR